MATPDITDFAPMYINQTINKAAKTSVTAERWNELWNLVIAQGDYNAEAIELICADLLLQASITYVDGLDAQNVKLTGDQTIAGIKTFSSSPIVPVATADTQAPQKLYVDTGDATQQTYTDDAIADLAGAGRTTETVKSNADNLITHKSSTDHDARYYTKTNVQTSGQAQVHWENLTNVPPMADASWKAPVADVASLPAVGNTIGDLRIVLDADAVYTWDEALTWIYIGASGNGISDHGTLVGLGDDDHLQYLLTNGGRALTGDMNIAGFQLTNFRPTVSDTAPASPVVGMFWYDTINEQLKVYKTAGWTDISGQGAISRRVEITATAGQTVFDVGQGSTYLYEVGTNIMKVYKKVAGNYVRVDKDDYVETDSETITLNVGALLNEEYFFEWFENTPEVINLAVQKDGTLQVNLNSDLLDGQHGSYYGTATDVATIQQELLNTKRLLSMGGLM